MQRLPLLRVAPELGDVDRHAVQEGVELLAVGLQAPGVVGQRRRAAALGPGADAPLHLRALVLEEVDAAERGARPRRRRE